MLPYNQLIQEEGVGVPIKQNRAISMVFNDNLNTEENEIIDTKAQKLVSLQPPNIFKSLGQRKISFRKQNIREPKINYVHPAHQNFNMVLNIMIGIKKSVDASLEIPMYIPTEKDYKIKCMYEIAPYRTSASDIVKACTFFDYAPQIFANIRKKNNIKKEQYSDSLGPEQIFGCMFNANFQTLAELCSSGKSGSFFYYTQDGRFVLKTIPRHEFKFMKKILPNYHDFLTNTNPQSFISKVYGIHKVIFYRKKQKWNKKIYFCIMNNVFHTSLKIDLRYDLKGSTFGRQTIKDKGGVMIDRAIALKDCDFIEKQEKIKVGHLNKERILDIINKDSVFFRENNIIDYSMLIGVTNRSEHPQVFAKSFDEAEISNPNMHSNGNDTPVGTLNNWDFNVSSCVSLWDEHFYQSFDGGMMSSDQQHIYFLGIIDIFTEYNTKKQMEHMYKSVTQNKLTISCVPPRQYGDRFYNFMAKVFTE